MSSFLMLRYVVSVEVSRAPPVINDVQVAGELQYKKI